VQRDPSIKNFKIVLIEATFNDVTTLRLIALVTATRQQQEECQACPAGERQRFVELWLHEHPQRDCGFAPALKRPQS
jgi:hypothetical protein